jgi:hypothetical protein
MNETRKTRFELRSLRRRVEIRGLSAIDQRTAGARSLLTWRAELIEALGGEAQLSPQIVTLVEQVTRLKLFLDHTDAFLLSLPSIVNSRKKKLIPIVKDRLALAAELRATLQLIGLKKIPKLVSSIDPERMEKILAVENEQETDGQRPESV